MLKHFGGCCLCDSGSTWKEGERIFQRRQKHQRGDQALLAAGEALRFAQEGKKKKKPRAFLVVVPLRFLALDGSPAPPLHPLPALFPEHSKCKRGEKCKKGGKIGGCGENCNSKAAPHTLIRCLEADLSCTN